MLSSQRNINGLSSKEAEALLAKNGPNELESAGSKSLIAIALDVFKEPMVILLVVCGILYMVLGSFNESISLIAGISVVIGITLYQERKTEKALAELKKLASPKATVIRDGIKSKIPGREVVTGDILLVNEGRTIAADAVLVESINLMVDESALSGESVPVRKNEYGDRSKAPMAGGEDNPYIYSGTMVVGGSGIAQVIATGNNTQLGKVGSSLKNIEDEKTPLQHEIGRFVKIMALAGIILCTLLVLVYYITKGNFVDGLLAGLALAMAMLPEEFPVVFTIFMALGAWRMSRRQVLVRKPSAIEALGTITVLCTDKTGTLTENIMQVSSLFTGQGQYDINYNPSEEIPEAFHELIEYSILASRNDPFDPMEKAIRKLGEVKLSGTEHIHQNWKLAIEYPLSSGLMAMSMAYGQENGNHIIATKGAPEAVMDLCHLSGTDRQELLTAVKNMAGSGLRVLGIAKAAANSLPAEQQGFSFSFLGLIGLSDPIRAEIPGAVKDCNTAGIRVILITGDYPATAQNIALQAGINNHAEVITGPDMDNMPDTALYDKVNITNVFARIRPEQKLRIVQALKHNGEIVAMTGDGINDAPALKAAHVGISMGEKGTDVARAASSLVLLDDNFASIVSAIKMGRRIFDNLQKAFSYITAIHIPIAGLALIPAVIPGLPVLLWPIHIAFHELIIDPVSSVVFEQEGDEKNIMSRPPRHKKSKFFGYRKIMYSLLEGTIALLMVLALYFISYNSGLSERSLRAVSFTALVLINLSLALSNLSKQRSIVQVIRRPNRSVKWILGAVCLILVLVLAIPQIRDLFMFDIYPFAYLLLIFTGVIIITIFFELLKLVRNRKIKSANIPLPYNKHRR